MTVRSLRARAPGLRRGGTARERGSVLVESAIVTPVALLLLLGVIEAGSLLRSHSSSANAVRSAGRMASVAGADPMTDQRVLARMAQEIAGLGGQQVDFVVIWHATGPGDRVPPACVPETHESPNTTSLGVSDGGFDAIGACNVYVRPDAPGGAFEMAAGRAADPPTHYFGCEGDTDPQAGRKVDCRWPGKVRRAVTTPRHTAGPVVPPDFVGVHVQVDHQLHTGLLMDAVRISDSTVNLIEPQGYEFS